MQRVRIGLTGLAFVFVVVLLAAVFTSQSAKEEPITARLIEEKSAPPTEKKKLEDAKQAQPKEPLAELGVAPGGAETNSSAIGDGGEQVEPGD